MKSNLVLCNMSVELSPRFRFQFDISMRFTYLKLKANQMDLVGCTVLKYINLKIYFSNFSTEIIMDSN
jgi:hypothetical protein